MENNAGAILTDRLPDLHLNGDSQCFPLYWYEKDDGTSLLPAKGEKVVKDDWGNRYVRHDAITDTAPDVFREAYPNAFLTRKAKDGPKELTKEDIFYYVYGILHSPEYRERFATNLQKELPASPRRGLRGVLPRGTHARRAAPRIRVSRAVGAARVHVTARHGPWPRPQARMGEAPRPRDQEARARPSDASGRMLTATTCSTRRSTPARASSGRPGATAGRT